MGKKMFDELVPLLKSERGMTPEVERRVVEVYGKRGKRALEAAKSGKVVLRRNRWFVRGKEDEYEVFRTFCTCKDYVINVATGKAKSDMCYHALAKSICEVLGTGYVVEE